MDIISEFILKKGRHLNAERAAIKENTIDLFINVEQHVISVNVEYLLYLLECLLQRP